MNDNLTTSALARPPLSAERLAEIRRRLPDVTRAHMSLLEQDRADLLQEVDRADDLLPALMGIALADCTEDNHRLREALARAVPAQTPEPTSLTHQP